MRQQHYAQYSDRRCSPTSFFPTQLSDFLMFTLVAMMLYLRSLQRGTTPRRRGWVLMLSYSAGTQIAVALPGRFFPHYYQLWLPVLSIGVGYSLNTLRAVTNLRHCRGIFTLVGAIACLICIREARFYMLSAEQWSREKYGGECIEARWVGLHINNWLIPKEMYYDAGMDPQFYFYSKRRILSGVFYSDAMANKPRGASLRRSRCGRSPGPPT